MSSNYPDREKWLAIRSTPRKSRAGRMVHVSTSYAWMPVYPRHPQGPANFIKVGRGVTYRRAQA